MSTEPNQSRITITDTEETIQSWIAKPYIPDELRERLAGVKILIVPDEGFRSITTPVFPVLTETLFKYLSDKLPPDVSIDICISDNDYTELALHSHTNLLPHFITTSLVLPFLINILSNYVYENVTKRNPAQKVEVKITVVSTNGTSKQIDYTGTADDFKKIGEEARKFWRDSEHY